MQLKDVPYDFVDGKAKVSLDSDNDGVPSMGLEVNLKELVQELLAKGETKEGEKVLKVSLDGLKVKMEIDSDKDGEKSFVLFADLPESFDEGSKRF